MREVISAYGAPGANRCCDCDGYRPDTLGGGIGLLPFWRYGTREFILVE